MHVDQIHKLSDAADAVEMLACAVGSGWGEEDDEARDLMRQSAYLLRVADWKRRVRDVLLNLDPVGEGCYFSENVERPRYLQVGEWTLDAQEFTFSTTKPHYADRRTNLTVRCYSEIERNQVILALIDAGLVDGWDGDESEFASAHSVHGYISVQVGGCPHPNRPRNN
jgi:hypothetical protein